MQLLDSILAFLQFLKITAEYIYFGLIALRRDCVRNSNHKKDFKKKLQDLKKNEKNPKNDDNLTKFELWKYDKAIFDSELQYFYVSNETINNLANFLKISRHLTSLDVGNTSISAKQLKILLNSIRQNKDSNLKHLDISTFFVSFFVY